jgi:hypothetical protein
MCMAAAMFASVRCLMPNWSALSVEAGALWCRAVHRQLLDPHRRVRSFSLQASRWLIEDLGVLRVDDAGVRSPMKWSLK